MPMLQIASQNHSQALDITRQVQEAVTVAGGVGRGWCRVYVPHTTAAVAINEAADPDVMADVLATLERLVPWQGPPYRHGEGNSAAHVKAILVGNSVQVPISNGHLALGNWQGVFFVEFDGPRQRQARVEISPA